MKKGLFGGTMKVLSIIDSFKGTLTSNELGQIATEVFSEKGFDASYYPISDGGDGFLDCIEKVKKCKKVFITIKGPLYKNSKSYYLIDEDEIVYIETAKCSGLNMVNKNRRNPLVSSTHGLGQMIKHAITSNYKTIYVGLGGSATNDAGAGMLEALGLKFRDKDNKIIKNINPMKLKLVESIEDQTLKELTKDIKFIILSDVTNPLLGLSGASYIFSPQKGATQEMVVKLEHILDKFSQKIVDWAGIDERMTLGSGAAGGLGYAFLTFLNCEYKKGIDSILEIINFKNLSKEFDYIVTGEGKIDKQSLGGKVIQGVLEHNAHAKIVLVSAINQLSRSDLSRYEIHKLYSIVDDITDELNSRKNPHKYFRELCERIEF